MGFSIKISDTAQSQRISAKLRETVEQYHIVQSVYKKVNNSSRCPGSHFFYSRLLHLVGAPRKNLLLFPCIFHCSE